MTDTSHIRLDTKDSPEHAVTTLAQHDPRTLALMIVNSILNDFIANLSPSSFSDERGQAPIPYQGWFWRSVDFFAPRGITIAMGDGQIAVCQNNKWDYPERDLTDEEQAEFRSLVWAAYQESRKGGALSEIHRLRDEALAEAGAFIASRGGPF